MECKKTMLEMGVAMMNIPERRAHSGKVYLHDRPANRQCMRMGYIHDGRVNYIRDSTIFGVEKYFEKHIVNISVRNIQPCSVKKYMAWNTRRRRLKWSRNGVGLTLRFIAPIPYATSLCISTVRKVLNTK
jgi:hypothetical protein